MTKEDFIKQYAARSSMTVEQFHATQVALPCRCDYDKCQGWAAVSNNELSIKTHKELYGDR